MNEPILEQPLETLRTNLAAEISTPLGPVYLNFKNNPMLTVSISRKEAFFQELARHWNQCLTDREDPHQALQSVLSEEEACMSLEARKTFLKDFLYAASEASSELENGAEAERESLEHHADQI